MTDFENWCRETGYNPHTFEALDAYREHLNATCPGWKTEVLRKWERMLNDSKMRNRSKPNE